ncbi:hypothetical protein BKH43_07395 [Helicobacter sp. 13S00401-1]|uniref:hypothetical protein n=1 Tax=Helicobacter sp. 13S00401-1 TaxID=1905758 RepID=UPI000BA71B15|nr:hypothetical protein [Helicobacter sp. 13S00401-1]PAF49009.1 hypothetical protein BKH43_07395 [Helicobacter sp. 13S00401-1]
MFIVTAFIVFVVFLMLLLIPFYIVKGLWGWHKEDMAIIKRREAEGYYEAREKEVLEKAQRNLAKARLELAKVTEELAIEKQKAKEATKELIRAIKGVGLGIKSLFIKLLPSNS